MVKIHKNTHKTLFEHVGIISPNFLLMVWNSIHMCLGMFSSYVIFKIEKQWKAKTLYNFEIRRYVLLKLHKPQGFEHVGIIFF
jgi:hypothetical protein